MIRKLLPALAALLAVPSVAAAQPLRDPAAAFGARPNILSMALSPNGQRLSLVQSTAGDGARIVVIDTANPQPRNIGGSEGENLRLVGCEFISNERLVCTLYGVQNPYGEWAGMSRLLAVNVDGSDAVALGERNSMAQLYYRAYGGGIIDNFGGTEGSVLMQQQFVPEQVTGRLAGRRGEGLGVVRVNTRNLSRTTVEPPRQDAGAYISDGRGRVRIMAIGQYSGAGQATGRTLYRYRRTGSNDWQDFGTFDEHDEGIAPVAVDPDLEVAYAYAKLNGRLALYRVSLDGSLRRELVASHPQVDVGGLIRIGRRNRVVGASFATDRWESVYFDPELRQLAERLHRSLPQQPMIDFVDASEDESKLLILAASDDDPGQYYLYDRASRSLTGILPARPELEGVTLASVRPISYRAADGTMVPGYLTLPPGSTGRGLPAIVMPHGGPGSRDYWGFDWLAQYFANRGFAVLQPNFRGSTGYGEAWFQQNGFRSWRTAIGDVNDAGRWLVSEGIADPARLAIFGWSYGGYAALQSNVLDPDLFKAAIAVAPVTDLELTRDRYARTSINAVRRDFFGTGPHIAEGSPARNAARFRAPVLMFHGDRDLNVEVEQARLMNSRLRDAGKQSELIVYPRLDHQLDDSTARADMLRRSDAFLRRVLNLGEAPAAPAPTPAPAQR
jgi:dipeptidyl aminopeptidase/acylaminoacyl peptidase